MAIDRVPFLKRCRSLGIEAAVVGLGKKSKRQPRRTGRKVSEYGMQLKEKQKAKFIYGVLEKQFRLYYDKAKKMQGVTGENLLLLLESRLDNIVFRMGIAPTRAAARQLVTHRHITIDGNVCSIPSALVNPGAIVAVRERSKNLEVIQDNISRSVSKYPWIEWDAASVSGKFLNYPDRTEIPEPINEQLIVELYSK